MIDSEKFFTYLKNKIPNFVKTSKGGKVLFSCPKGETHKFQKDMPSMFPKSGCDKFYCGACGLTATIYDCVRLLEEDKKALTDGQIIEYLINTTKMELFPELDEYKKYGWSLIPIAKNGKVPLEKSWTSQTHYEKSDWLNWINQGLNLGVRTGEVSRIVVIDADLKIAPTPEFEEIYKELTASKTLTQNSPQGKHFVFLYDKDLKQTVKIKGVTIDIRNDGGQFLVSPSKINNVSYNWVNLGSEIKSIPENIKAKLLSVNKVDEGRNEKLLEETHLSSKLINPAFKLITNNEGTYVNDAFVHIGGKLIKFLPPKDVEEVLYILNKDLVDNPMPSFAIKSMVGSLEGYKQTEEETQAHSIYDACKLIQVDISAKDIIEHVFPGEKNKRAIVDKYLIQFHKEGKLVRPRRGRYDIKEAVEWTDEPSVVSGLIKFDMPYFSNISQFRMGDILLLGAPQGYGKTHIAMNIIKQLREQQIKPYYISLETASRHQVIAEQLGLVKKDYYISKNPIDNPIQVELEPNAITLLDWIYTGEDFSATLSIFKHLNDEMNRKKGILIVFTQLKENYDYFAVNLIKSFPSFAARFIYDSEDRLVSHFQIDKIREPIGNYSTAIIETVFNSETKELKLKNNL